jgi:hypothetical protein
VLATGGAYEGQYCLELNLQGYAGVWARGFGVVPSVDSELVSDLDCLTMHWSIGIARFCLDDVWPSLLAAFLGQFYTQAISGWLHSVGLYFFQPVAVPLNRLTMIQQEHQTTRFLHAIAKTLYWLSSFCRSLMKKCSSGCNSSDINQMHDTATSHAPFAKSVVWSQTYWVKCECIDHICSLPVLLCCLLHEPRGGGRSHDDWWLLHCCVRSEPCQASKYLVARELEWVSQSERYVFMGWLPSENGAIRHMF